MAKRTVKWAHPSIKYCGKGYGELVEMNDEAAGGYEAAGWCVGPDELLPGESDPGPEDVEDVAAYEGAVDGGTLAEEGD